MPKSKFYGLIGSGLAVTLAISIPLAHAFGVRMNVTESAPTGLYLLNKEATPKRGDLVEVCPPNSAVIHIMANRGYLLKGVWGNCKNTNVTPLLKSISAVSGDTVEIEPGRLVKVNGVYLPNTQPMPSVPSYPPGFYIVQDGEYWTFSTYSSGSFDSRYFGPVSLNQLVGQATPILIKGDISKVTLGVKKE